MFFNFCGKHFAQSVAKMAAMRSVRSISATCTRQKFYRDPMALWFYDPFRPLMRRRAFVDPFAALDHFFDDNLVPQIRENAAKLDIDDKGLLTYTVDTAGYRPEELQVNVEGDEIVVQGEHKQQNENETVHRQFIRRVRIPNGYQKESLKCEMDASGRLSLCAQKAQNGKEESRSIPIEMKKAVEEK